MIMTLKSMSVPSIISNKSKRINSDCNQCYQTVNCQVFKKNGGCEQLSGLSELILSFISDSELQILSLNLELQILSLSFELQILNLNFESRFRPKVSFLILNSCDFDDFKSNSNQKHEVAYTLHSNDVAINSIKKSSFDSN